MIDTPTTLVFGAGVSSSYGFPLSKDLLQDAIGLASHSLLPPSRRELPVNWWDGLKIAEHERVGFSEALDLSYEPSVDAFLESRPDFLEIGKVIMAVALIGYERPRNLRREGFSERIYDYIWRHLRTDKPEDWGKNQISIITFNYDRSLEYALFNALKHKYKLDDPDAAMLVSQIQIVHPYGTLGRPHYERLAEQTANTTSLYREYSEDLSYDSVSAATSGIKLTGDRQEDSAEFVKARNLLVEADKIAFLGFGYDPTNLKRLSHKKGWHPRKVYGTAFEFEDNEVKVACSILNRYWSPRSTGQSAQLIPTDALTLLRKLPILTH